MLGTDPKCQSIPSLIRPLSRHADASKFALGISKPDAYRQLLDAMESLADGQGNWVCNLANASSLLWHMYHSLGSPLSSVNWAGFYVLDATDPSQLILGPFHGKVACQAIKIGKGVCGTVAKEEKTLLLEDVNAFPGHIACDGDTKSEVVAPIKVEGKVSPPQKSSA
jgi:L-methionine (R)-S-oxide reductase